MRKLFIGILIINMILMTGCSTIKIQKYDEVIYDCGSKLVKGTEINISEWDLENGVESYYLYEDDYTLNNSYEYPMREWFEDFNAVKLNKGENGCKEILRFYNYTEIGGK